MIGLTAAAASMHGCILGGFTLVEGTGGSAGGTSTGTGGSDAAPDAPIKCGVTYPPPPAGGTPGGAITFVTAMHSVDMGDMGSKKIGFDLDGLCTCGVTGDGPPCKEVTQHCDDDQGVDNSAQGLFSLLKLGLGGVFGSSFFTGKANDGVWSVLLRVSNYNGEANDAQVTLDWFIPGGFGGVPPTWTGSDQWPINATCLDNVDLSQPAGGVTVNTAKFTDPNAYVTDGKLVGTMPETPINFAGQGANGSFVNVKVTGAFIVADITPQPPSSFKLTGGVVVGRWPVKEVFATIASYRDGNNLPICMNNAFYNTGKAYVCNAPDILTGINSPTKACDALSFGFGFTADPAMLGMPFMPPAPTGSCTAAEGDPATDNCPQLVTDAGADGG